MNYYSTVYTQTNKTLRSKLERCFNKSVKHVFKTPISRMTLPEQFGLLEKIKILPLRMRLFQRFILFACKMFIQDNVQSLRVRFRATKSGIRQQFFQIRLMSICGEKPGSFTNLASKIINFLDSDLKCPTLDSS